MDYTPSQIKRIAQIITHRHPMSDAFPASSAIAQAKRIYAEVVPSPEPHIVELSAENAGRKLGSIDVMSNHELGDAPIEPAYREKMQELAKAVDLFFNGGKTGKDRETGFVLLVFPFGNLDTGRCNFISNGADRKDIVVLFKEMIARFEGQPEVKGRA